MDISAYKMDGLGNDFVIIDNRSDPVIPNKDQIIKICDRKFIGCDQLIIINNHKTSDAHLEFFNSDGIESGACGNGTRCIAEFISRENKQKKRQTKQPTGEAQPPQEQTIRKHLIKPKISENPWGHQCQSNENNQKN